MADFPYPCYYHPACPLETPLSFSSIYIVDRRGRYHFFKSMAQVSMVRGHFLKIGQSLNENALEIRLQAFLVDGIAMTTLKSVLCTHFSEGAINFNTEQQERELWIG